MEQEQAKAAPGRADAGPQPLPGRFVDAGEAPGPSGGPGALPVEMDGGMAGAGDESAFDAGELGLDAGAADAATEDPDAATVDQTAYTGIYTDDDKWFCRPGMTDNPCTAELAITDVLPDQSTSVVELAHAPADAPADCFYLYPTLDVDSEAPPRNLDFPDVDRDMVHDIAFSQAVPFRDLCNLYAPIYRQSNLNGLADETTREAQLEHGYRDVEQAFDYLLSDVEPGRPLILIAHSQGSMMMIRLLERRLSADPSLLDRLVVASLAGPLGNFVVPRGAQVGGSLSRVPLCSDADEVRCALTWNTFWADVPPGAGYGHQFGALPQDRDLGCNPGFYSQAAMRLGGALIFTRYASLDISALLNFGRARVDTAYARYRDFYVGRCGRADNGLQYLSVGPEPMARDRRADPLPFWLLALTDPNIGLHAFDYLFVMDEIHAAVGHKLAVHLGQAAANTPP